MNECLAYGYMWCVKEEYLSFGTWKQLIDFCDLARLMPIHQQQYPVLLFLFVFLGDINL